MKYQLTVICPGIRTKNWLRLYESISNAFKYSWEIIFISPYNLPEELKDKDNIQWIQSWASPISCQQQGLCKSQGVFISWAADDGYYLKDSLTLAYDNLMKDSSFKPHGEFLVKSLGITNTGIAFNNKKLVMGKYYEGNNDGDMPMQDDKYYILANHDATRIKWIPDTYYMLNVGLVPTSLLLEVGGWDAENFQVCPMAYNDLAVRLQRYGVEFIVQNEMMFKCSHMPGHEGDHGPIHDAQIDFDQPKFRQIYWTNNCMNRIKIDINNWKLAPEKWSMRFGK